ncbi:MAG TPA: hypothetical protein VFW39_07510 [Sphingomicrobium sp.]|nr:hypothetical protein [Sphingomicrobium sp.]
MKHFINQEMLAPNVLTVPVDMDVIGEFVELADTAESDPEYCTLRPTWKSDIRWISPESGATFDRFQSAFDRLDVARHVRQYLDLDSDPRLYAGFLHTRSECTDANFHVDWMLTNNEAFTMLAPVCGFGDGQKLLYKKMTGDIAEYEYRPGEAIVFGDHFIHSTPPGSFDPPFTLLVFNFGTDKMEHWDKIMATTGKQCRLIQRPDGRLDTLRWSDESSWTIRPYLRENDRGREQVGAEVRGS